MKSTSKDQGYSCPTRIHFGSGSSSRLAQVKSNYRSLVVFTTMDELRHAKLIDILTGSNLPVTIIRHRGEPDVVDAEKAARKVAECGAECVIAIGGGSIIDLAKAAAALAVNSGGAMRYLEVVGEGAHLETDPLPVIAVPTTFGTGSEVTRNAVLGVPEHRRKVSLRDPRMVPKVALIDPDLAIGVPQEVAAASGIDALIHVCESYVSNSPCNALVQRSRNAIASGFSNLSRMVLNSDSSSREAMAEVSLCGGLCIANCKLGAVHGIAGVLGGVSNAGHGEICGAVFAEVMKTNLGLLGKDHPSQKRYADIAQLAKPGTTIDEVPLLIEQLCADIGLRRLGDLGVERDLFTHISVEAQKSSSMRGNPVNLSSDQIKDILEKAH